MLKLKKNDEVVVIAGRDRGKRGEVLRVLSNERLLVGGINLVKKHQRGNPNTGEQGGIISKEAPIHVSNLSLWNDETDKPDRVRFEFQDGKKVRVFKSTGKVIKE